MDGGRARKRKAALAALLFALHGLACQDAKPARTSAPPATNSPATSDRALSLAWNDPALMKPASALVSSILDPRIAPLLRAADRWRKSLGPERRIVDQVYLVPDVPSFFEAISHWDQEQFFPVLIDDPAWTLPFLRAFRPARVVRYRLPQGETARPQEGKGPSGEPSPMPLWQRTWLAARRAVARAWTADAVAEADLPPAGGVPSKWGPTPPGLVLSNPDSPMLAGGVALAAGRFQPLVFLEPIPHHAGAVGDPAASQPNHFSISDRLTLPQAHAFARKVEALAAATAGPHGARGLGDSCDFLTLAGDWPYIYRVDRGPSAVQGEYALDDLIGRVLPDDQDKLVQATTRWAYTGRLLGDPAASVYRAMCALFLQPEASLLWNTYSKDQSWSDYDMAAAARTFGRLWPGDAVPIHRAGADADLAAWHNMFDPVNRFGWIMINSSGFPRQFSITGGPGRPADLPRGRPSAVSTIHSFSASDPTDPSTIAGRWLESGAFVYFGATNEPYLHSFRPPRLIADLIAADLPLSAVIRQGDHELYGRPWRLVYLGDPLYRLASSGSLAAWNRLAPDSAQKAFPDQNLSTAMEITPTVRVLNPAANASDRLQWCLTAAIAELCHPGTSWKAPENAAQKAVKPPPWRSILLSIDRQQLDPISRPILDELVIDSLLQSRSQDRLQTWLLRIPPDQRRPRVWMTLESLAMSRLATFASTGQIAPALDLWEDLMRLPWPAHSEFPAQFTERLAAIVDADSLRNLEPYHQCLTRATRSFAAIAEYPHAALVRNELQRVEKLLVLSPEGR
jgi:hypothetical protein